MDLSESRLQIDAVDDEIVRLLCRRLEIVEAMWRYKRENGIPFEDPERERAVVDRLAGQVPEALRPYVGRLYETMFALSRQVRDDLNEHKPITNNTRNMAKYVCDLCGYEYDPAVGDPDNGVAPGTAFENIPADWVCPLCGAGKEDFSPVK